VFLDHLLASMSFTSSVLISNPYVPLSSTSKKTLSKKVVFSSFGCKLKIVKLLPPNKQYVGLPCNQLALFMFDLSFISSNKYLQFLSINNYIKTNIFKKQFDSPKIINMKSNFIRDKENTTTETKGVAIRISSDLYHKMEQEETPRNELVSHALNQFFEKEHNSNKTDEEIPIEIYEEIYSTLHNTEITPLKKDIDRQKYTIDSLKTQIVELKQDKQFLMDHCNDLITTFQKNQNHSFWQRRKKRKQQNDSCDE